VKFLENIYLFKDFRDKGKMPPELCECKNKMTCVNIKLFGNVDKN